MWTAMRMYECPRAWAVVFKITDGWTVIDCKGNGRARRFRNRLDAQARADKLNA